ncbi:MAG: hypothetical protein LUC91_01240, partial [Prevotella sp.]|nr:hypothetical protein [Prevotella sp.]
MHRFIQSNKNKNSLTFVTKYNWPVEVELNGKAVLLQIDHLEDIVNIAKHRSESTKLVGFVYRNDYASFETIDVDPKWGSIAV